MVHGLLKEFMTDTDDPRFSRTAGALARIGNEFTLLTVTANSSRHSGIPRGRARAPAVPVRAGPI
jgi:hypothetical protein